MGNWMRSLLLTSRRTSKSVQSLMSWRKHWELENSTVFDSWNPPLFAFLVNRIISVLSLISVHVRSHTNCPRDVKAFPVPLFDNPAALSLHYWYWLKTCIRAINVWDFKIDVIHLCHVATVLEVIALKWLGILQLSPVLMWHHVCDDLIPHCTPE